MPILFDTNTIVLFSVKGKIPVRIGIINEERTKIYCPKFDSYLPTSMIDIYEDNHHLDTYDKAFCNVAINDFYNDYINKSTLLRVEKEMNKLLTSKVKQR